MPIQKHTHEHSPIHTLICTRTHIAMRPTLKYATNPRFYTKNERENLLFKVYMHAQLHTHTHIHTYALTYTFTHAHPHTYTLI